MVDKGEFFLKGYIPNQNIELTFNGYLIKLPIDTRKIERLTKLNYEIEDTLETCVLSLSGLGEKEALLDLSEDIAALLSLRLGKRVIFDRQKYYSNGHCEAVEKLMGQNKNEGEQIIPDSEVSNFLKKTLPNLSRLSKAEKINILTITDYLNQTRHGYIEDRIMRLVQAWECSAQYWTQETELSQDLKDLRSKIKEVFIQWRKEKGFIDKEGALGTKITASIDQEKLMARLDRLVMDSGFIVEKINLDLASLKNLRDDVAHTGRIKINGSEALKYLQPGVMGLQLILLKRLGYDGLVNGVKDGRINDYFL